MYNYISFISKGYNHQDHMAVKDLQAISLWPQPHTPYKLWMFFLSAIILERIGENEHAREALFNIIDDPVLVHPAHQEVLHETISSTNHWEAPEFINTLSSAVWPRHCAESYEHEIFHILCNNLT